MLRDFFAFLVGKAWSSVALPATGETIWLGDEWKSKAESAYARASKACAYDVASNHLAATGEWKKVFCDLFTG
jgi:hypothetical protein